MKTNKEQEKNVTNEDLATFKCETDLQPKIVFSKPTTGYTFNPDFSWGTDTLPVVTDAENYGPIRLRPTGQYEGAWDGFSAWSQMLCKARLTDCYNDVFRCIVAKLDQEVAKATKAVDDSFNNFECSNYQRHNFCRGVEAESRTIRDYVQKLFNDTSFRYRELYELLGDK